MIPATCHADREHVAHGLCDCCYRSTVYYAEREAQLARNKAYRKANAAELRAKRKARYAPKNFPVPVLDEPEPSTRPTDRNRRVSDEARESITLRQDNPARDNSRGGENLSDKSWWREEAKPRRWIIEAQQEAA